MDWFEIDEAQVRSIFSHDFQYVPVANSCNVTSTKDSESRTLQATITPNPFKTNFDLKFSTEREWIKVSLYDSVGMQLRVLTSQVMTAGEHTLRVDGSDLAAGIYFVRIQGKRDQKTLRVVKG